MMTPTFLYLVDEDLYRLGNASSPKLDNVRSDDVIIYERNGIAMVGATGDGISLITESRLQREAKWRKEVMYGNFRPISQFRPA